MQKVGKLPLVTSFDAYSYQGSHKGTHERSCLKAKEVPALRLTHVAECRVSCKEEPLL